MASQLIQLKHTILLRKVKNLQVTQSGAYPAYNQGQGGHVPPSPRLGALGGGHCHWRAC